MRIAVSWGMRGLPLRHRLAFGELLEDAAHDRLHRVPDVFLGDEAHSGRAGRIRPAGGRRAGLRRGSRARSGSSGRSRQPSAAACTAAGLQQGEELAFMDAGRNEEVARAFRRGCRQDRRRYSAKPISDMRRRMSAMIWVRRCSGAAFRGAGRGSGISGARLRDGRRTPAAAVPWPRRASISCA